MLDRENASPWPEAIASFIDAAIVLVFVGIRHREIVPLLKLHKLDRRNTIQLLALTLAFVLSMSLYFNLIQAVGVPIYRVSESFQRAGWPLWSMIVLVSIMPTVFEELAFRGAIQSALEVVFSNREAWIIQAALFSVSRARWRIQTSSSALSV